MKEHKRRNLNVFETIFSGESKQTYLFDYTSKPQGGSIFGVNAL